MTEENFSIKEMLTRLEAKVDLNTSMTSDTAIKVGVQNGRVSTQEKWSAEAKLIIENNAKNIETLKDEYKGDKKWIKGVMYVIAALMIIVPMTCTVIFGIYIKNRDYEIDAKIKTGIDNAFNSRFSNVEVIK